MAALQLNHSVSLNRIRDITDTGFLVVHNVLIHVSLRFVMSAFQSTSSKSFTSTPLKSTSNVRRSIPRSKSVESADDSTYSLLSPIYHDSFDFSDEDNDEEPNQCQLADNPSLTVHEDVLSVSPIRYFASLVLTLQRQEF